MKLLWRVDIEEKGIIALDAKIFYEIIRRLPDNNVTIKTDDKLTATITCEKAKFTIPGKSGEDFAYLPIIEREESLDDFPVYIKGNDSSDNFLNCI